MQRGEDKCANSVIFEVMVEAETEIYRDSFAPGGSPLKPRCSKAWDLYYRLLDCLLYFVGQVCAGFKKSTTFISDHTPDIFKSKWVFFVLAALYLFYCFTVWFGASESYHLTGKDLG